VRVSVDALYALPDGGGTWTYLRALLRELPACDAEARYTVFTNREGGKLLDPTAVGTVRAVRCPVPGGSARLAYEYAALPAQIVRAGTDVLFAPAFTLPAAPGAASVVTIHDLRHEELPASFPPLHGAMLRRLARAAARRADHVIVTTDRTRARLIACYNLDPERVHTVPLAADAAFFAPIPEATRAAVRERHGLYRPYLLSLAQPSWQKNLAALVEAYLAWRVLDRTDTHLVLPGWRPGDAPELWAKVRAAGREADVRCIGRVPDADLPALYAGAAAFVLPSRYEGFGIPLLEAMACGTPVLATTAAALPEVAGDAALLFAPDDRPALVAALRHLLDDPALRASLVARGHARARQFSWHNTAAQTYAVLARAHAEWQRAGRDRSHS